MDDGGHWVHLDLWSVINVFGPFCSSLPWDNPVSAVYGQFLWHGLCSDTVNCGTLHRPVCAFPNHLHSTDVTIYCMHIWVLAYSILFFFNCKNYPPKSFFTLSLLRVVCRPPPKIYSGQPQLLKDCFVCFFTAFFLWAGAFEADKSCFCGIILIQYTVCRIYM